MAAVVLGAFAVAVDNVLAVAGLIVVASTGLSWGGAAALAGAWSPRPGSAAVSGLVVLAGAVATYYLGIAALNTREVDVGSLWSAASTWGLVAAAAGPAIGLLGWFARHGTVAERSASWGAAGGLLMSQGVYMGTRIVRDGLWTEGGPANMIATVLIAIPAAAVFLGARRGALGLALLTMAVVALIGAAGWSLVLLALRA